ALRSASAYTATVPTPMRCAVRITRQAISPRLAIRILRNTLALPRGLALLEERRDPLFPLRRGADLGDPPCGVGAQRIVDRPAGNVAHQVLDAGVGGSGAGEQLLPQLTDECVQLSGRHYGGEQADAQRLGGVEYLGAEEIAARGARPDSTQHIGADGRGREPELRFGEGKLRLRRADRDVAGRDESRAAGERWPVHARNGGFIEPVERRQH